jgi:hypothetical protein
MELEKQTKLKPTLSQLSSSGSSLGSPLLKSLTVEQKDELISKYLSITVPKLNSHRC